jgi:hypothetical protein
MPGRQRFGHRCERQRHHLRLCRTRRLPDHLPALHDVRVSPHGAVRHHCHDLRLVALLLGGVRWRSRSPLFRVDTPRSAGHTLRAFSGNSGMTRRRKPLWNRRVEVVLAAALLLAAVACLTGPSALARADGVLPDPSRVCLLPASARGPLRLLSFLPSPGVVFRGEGMRDAGGTPPGSGAARVRMSRIWHTDPPRPEALLPEKASALGRLQVDAHAPPPAG